MAFYQIIIQAKQTIVDEVENIKNSAGYSHLSFEAYCTVWDECYKEVSQIIYTKSYSTDHRFTKYKCKNIKLTFAIVGIIYSFTSAYN